MNRHPGRLAPPSGQASLMMLAVIAVVLAGGLLLFAFGNALGARGRYQRAADLAAISAAQVMRDLYPRLFEPPFLEHGVPNPRHLDEGAYRAAAVAAAVRGGRRNGVTVRSGGRDLRRQHLRRDQGDSPGAGRDRVAIGGRVAVAALAGARRGRGVRSFRFGRVPRAELSPAAGGAFPAQASGGGYGGPLAYRQGKPMRPDVALAFDRMAAAARDDGVFLAVTSGFRSDAEQARLFAAHPDPKWVAPPGQSLHRYATELDLGPPAAYGWLAANAPRFGFVQRYQWEPWHSGFTRGIGSSSVGFGAGGAARARPRERCRSFVPGRFAPVIVRAAQRWSVSAQLLAAQLYAESASTRSPAHPRAPRASRSSCPGPPPPWASRTRSTPTPRSMPRRT